MAKKGPPSSSSPPLNSAQLLDHRHYLFRYALLQLRDPVLAEDMVQETLLAALEGQGQFSGKSTLRTWMTGILKRKIVDQIRRQAREVVDSDLEGNQAQGAEIDDLFMEDGHWETPPRSWGDPEKALEQKKFWEAFDFCLTLMPAKTARVFVMREIQELSTEEICKELKISSTNCWVMLYRARMSLRQCLEVRWFGGKD